MNIRDLEYLVALAEHRHFRRAADSCHVSQPTLSGQIRKLEDELGVMLLERTSRKVLFTQAGLLLVDQARTVLREVKVLKEMASQQGETMSGPLHIGLIPTIGPYLLPHIIPMLHQTFPKLEMYLHEAQTHQLLAQLDSGKLDCAILALVKESEAFIEVPLFDEPMMLAIYEDHPWANRDRVPMSDLAGEKLLMLEDGHCLRDQAMGFCFEAGADEDTHFRATSLETLPNMSVADNLFIGREPRRFGLLRRKEMEARATALMASYGFSLDVREPLNRFSVAMQQIVAICRAIDLSAKVLILDEPTASLDTQEVEMLFTLMRQLRDNGVSLIFVTHFLDQVYAVSDRITVLRNGTFVGCRETRELPQIELVKMMLGRELDHNALQRAGRTLLSDKPVAAFEGYGKKGTIAPFDLQVRPGEIVGLAGLLGSGRTETAEVIFGIKTADSGKAWIKGKPQTLRSPHQASCLGIGFCPEDRKTDGIIAAASVRENIVLALQAQRGWLRPIPRREQNEIAERFIRQLGIRTPSAEQPIEFLSGGNQQKVLLSRWLLTKPQFLILDEPTRGIDVGAHAEIIRLIETLCADGLALLVISSELEELVG